MYSVRLHDGKSTVAVYKKSAPPITHLGGLGAASHAQLVELIRAKDKHRGLSQEEGDFLGFTVSKGHPTVGLANKYSFTSQGSNDPVFRTGAYEPSHGVTEDWGIAIHDTIERLSVLEVLLGYIFGSAEAGAASLEADRRLWVLLADVMWPATTPSQAAYEMKKDVVPDDDWET